MWKHWLLPGILAERLRRDEISNREVAHFMLGNLVFGWIVYYSGLTWANEPWTVLSLWEALILLVVVVFGMVHCFDAAGGDANPRFAAQFNCLSFPIALWTTIIAWSLFWAFSWAYRTWSTSLVSPGSEISGIYIYVMRRFGWFATTAAVVGAQIMFFAWMKKALRKTLGQGTSPAPSGDPGA